MSFVGAIIITSYAEYNELDQKLDALDQVLDLLERRRDKLHEEARQLLVDARAARTQSSGGEVGPMANGHDDDDDEDVGDSNGDCGNSESENKE